MRSSKTEFFLWLKALIMGGSYDGETYPGVSGVNHFGVWNSELVNSENKDNFALPAIFVEYTTSPDITRFNMTGESSQVPGGHKQLNFILHIITDKTQSVDRYEDYLKAYDLEADVYLAIQNREMPLTNRIKRIEEIEDSSSSVLKDLQASYMCVIQNEILSEFDQLTDADISVNVGIKTNI